MLATDLLNFQNELLAELTYENCVHRLCQKISQQTASSVLITNPSYRVIACSALLEETEELSQKYLKVSPLAVKDYYRITAGEGQAKPGFLFPLRSNHEICGYLIVIHKNPQAEEIRQMAEQAGKICTLALLTQEQHLKVERRYQDAFIFDLLYGNIVSNEDIIARGELWGWNFRLPHCVLVFELDDYEQYSADKELVLTLQDIITAEITKLSQAPIVFRKKGEVAVILVADKSNAHERIAYLDLLVKKIMALAEERLSPRIVRVGSGRTYQTANEIFRSYQEAKVALELGRIMNIRSKTPFFRELGLARILYNHDQQELAEFYWDTLGDLVRYDAEQSGDLVKTLEQYLLNSCDLKAAADALFLHPNTLRYRLRRIEEILEINLNDFDTKLDLMTAFKIKHIKKV
ncbi:MAG: PucR family transcriptional regulator [Desulfitobacteriia bacterium]